LEESDLQAPKDIVEWLVIHLHFALCFASRRIAAPSIGFGTASFRSTWSVRRSAMLRHVPARFR